MANFRGFARTSEANEGFLVKNRVPVAVVLMAALSGFIPLSLSAQKADAQKADTHKGGSTASSLKIGTVNVSFGGFLVIGNKGRFSEGVQITSAQYDLAAEEVTAVQAPPRSGHSGLAGATAEGSLAKKTQVVAHIKRPVEGEEFKVSADHAVYVPEYGRPDGGRIDFTGHVTVVSRSGFLAGPAPADFENGPVTVLLGRGEDYPQLQTGPGHIVVTPAQ